MPDPLALTKMLTTPSASNTRQLSPYEKNHLLRHGYKPSDVANGTYGEMPVEYITGHVEFMGHDFIVTPDVLIPRIETEELVGRAVNEATRLAKKPSTNTDGMLYIADVGTGSGAIAISLYLELQKKNILCQIIATDVSDSAIQIAKHNAAILISSGNENIHFLQSDLLADIPTTHSFDLIVTNLPYIPTARIKLLDESVKAYEPHVALDGGLDGLSLIERLLTQAPPFLSKESIMLLEVDYSHTDLAWQKWRQEWYITPSLDSFTKNRFVTFEKK